MPLCELPPAIYRTLPRPADVTIYWAKDIPAAFRVCGYFKAYGATACFVPGIRLIVMPRGLGVSDRRACLAHEYAHANGYRHPPHYRVARRYSYFGM